MLPARQFATRDPRRPRRHGKRARGAALLALSALATTIAWGAPPSAASARNGPAPQAAARASVPKEGRPPNIVLIMADDLGVEGVDSFGGEYFTPNLDRLSRQGLSFDNAHATPLCTPTRVRLMTGQENARSYQAFGYLSPHARTFGHLMKEAGYATGVIGKWQLSGNGFDGRVGITPDGAGFDEWVLWQVQTRSARGSRYWGPTLTSERGTVIFEEGFGPDKLDEAAQAFVRRHRDKPFFLYYPMLLPHDPFINTPDSPRAATDKAKFSGMVTYMDKLVGHLMEALEREGVADNTFVIFTADNGTERAITSYRGGASVVGGKGTPTIRGTHVPLIVRWPGHSPQGIRTDALFDLMDIYPTLASLLDRKSTETDVDGVDQLDVIRGGVAAARETIFMHYDPVWVQEPARFAFDARWKLYGDGRFVRIDAASGAEVDARPGASRDAARAHARLRKVLDAAPDKPFDPNRFPMCIGEESLEPGVPAVRAGCPSLRNPPGREPGPGASR